MANNKKTFILFLFFIFSILNIDFSFAQEDTSSFQIDNMYQENPQQVEMVDEYKEAIANGDYGAIYDGLEEADFEYIFGIDPHQPDEYTRYMYSPYPLFRSGVTLIFKSQTIAPGYYLLTPREKNGKTYILFKDNGKIKHIIPAYKIENISEDYYQTHFPQQQLNFSQKSRKKAMDFIGKKWGKRNQRTPIPKAYIEFNDATMYWDMILYYGDKKYYLIFKKG